MYIYKVGDEIRASRRPHGTHDESRAAVAGLELDRREDGEVAMNHRLRAYVDPEGAWRLAGSHRLVALPGDGVTITEVEKVADSEAMRLAKQWVGFAEADRLRLLTWVRSQRLDPGVESSFTPNAGGLRDAREAIAYKVAKATGLDIVRARELVKVAEWSP